MVDSESNLLLFDMRHAHIIVPLSILHMKRMTILPDHGSITFFSCPMLYVKVAFYLPYSSLFILMIYSPLFVSKELVVTGTPCLLELSVMPTTLHC